MPGDFPPKARALDRNVHKMRNHLHRAKGIEDELAWVFEDGTVSGLRLRGQVAVPTNGANAKMKMYFSLKVWGQFLACFDLPGLAA